MYPQELREKAIQAYKNKEGTYRELEQRYGIPGRTINRWVERALNPTEPIKIGRPFRFDEASLEVLRELKQNHPEVSLTRLAKLYAQQTGQSVPAHETMRDAMLQLGYSYQRNQTKQQTQVEPALPTVTDSPTPVAHRYQETHRSTPKTTMSRPAYPSDLSDAQWNLLEPLFEKTETRGRKRKVPLREIVNALSYTLRTGCQWRYLPHDFPKWTLVAKTFYRLKENGKWEQIHNVLRENTRLQAGREPTPSAGIIDSQSVKTTEIGGTKGFDAGKKSKVENAISS